MKLNNKGFALSSIVYSILILFILLVFCILSILGSRKLLLDKTKNNVLESLQQEKNTDTTYKDPSGASAPELLDGMIPIVYDEDNSEWVVADLDSEWYNYGDKKWANAVILNESADLSDGFVDEEDIALWYVWIPRFKYTLFNTTGSSYNNCTASTCPIIEIEFEEGIESTGTVSCVQDIDSSLSKAEICSDVTNDGLVDGTSTYTHPAFTLGDKELTGFWIGKFEISLTDSKMTILPNKSPHKAISTTLFDLVKNAGSTYNINGDSHMIKNIEWGAVAYLKQSNYGLGTTDIGKNGTNKTGYGASTSYYYSTINGMKASTTGNIYGVYDMSGGLYEYVMGTIDDTSIDKKYVDKYTSSYFNKLGDATIETKGFYTDFTQNLTSNKTWYVRGAYYNTSSSYTGIFAFHSSNANLGLSSYITTRAVLTK